MAVKRKLSATAADREGERAKRSIADVNSEPSARDLAEGQVEDETAERRDSVTTATDVPAKDVGFRADGWMPQLPHEPTLEEAVEDALRWALDQETWFPPGLTRSLSEAEKQRITAQVTANYKNPVKAYFRERGWKKVKEEAEGSDEGGTTVTACTGSDGLQTLTRHEDQDEAAQSVAEHDAPLGMFETPEPPIKTASLDLSDVAAAPSKSIPYNEVPWYVVSGSGYKPQWRQDAERISRRKKAAAAIASARSKQHALYREQEETTVTTPGRAKAAKKQAPSIRTDSHRPEREVHLQNLSDVRDLLGLVQTEMASIEANSTGDVKKDKAFGYLGFQSALLKRQLQVLKWIEGPSYRPKTSELPDLLKQQVTKAFPFRTPVPVELIHTRGRLDNADIIAKIKGVFDTDTYAGICGCIGWLKYQIAQLKKSPLHYQHREKRGSKESAFLQDTSSLLDAMCARLGDYPPPPPPNQPSVEESSTGSRTSSSSHAGSEGVQEGTESTKGAAYNPSSPSDDPSSPPYSPMSPSYSPRSPSLSPVSSFGSPLHKGEGFEPTLPFDTPVHRSGTGRDTRSQRTLGTESGVGVERKKVKTDGEKPNVEAKKHEIIKVGEELQDGKGTAGDGDEMRPSQHGYGNSEGKPQEHGNSAAGRGHDDRDEGSLEDGEIVEERSISAQGVDEDDGDEEGSEDGEIVED